VDSKQAVGSGRVRHPGITKGMLIYVNLVTEDLHALPTRMFPICEGITIGIRLSPDFSPLRNEVTTNLRLQMIANEILAQRFWCNSR
jgi:hypothetical protein